MVGQSPKMSLNLFRKDNTWILIENVKLSTKSRSCDFNPMNLRVCRNIRNVEILRAQEIE